MKMNRVIGFLRLLRPVNCLMMGFAVIVGALLVMADPPSQSVLLKFLFGFVTAFTLTGASMAVNDYFDREIDGINEPNRPIPSGVVKPREALIFSSVLVACGFAAALLTNLSCLIISVFSWVVSLSYVTKGKRTGLLGNFFVSICVAISLIYGSFVIDRGFSLNVALFASLAFLLNTGREVAKGIVDVKGDESKRVRTIAVSYGEKTAAYVASSFFLSAVLLSFSPILLGFASFWFIPFAIVADLGFAASAVMLIRNPTRENARRLKNLLLLWMMIGLIAFLAGTI